MIALYSLACGVLITRIVLLRRDLVELHKYIVEQQSVSAVEMPWFGTNPPWATELLNDLMIGVTIGGYIGSVLFFLYQRRETTRDE